MFGLVPFNFKGVQRRNNDSLLNLFNDFWDTDDNFFGSNYSIKADVKDLGDKYLVEAELPGVNKEDIKLTLKDDLLTISYKIDKNEEEKSDNYIRRERRSGLFSRSFCVEDIDDKDIDAKYENGILAVSLKKLDKKPSKQDYEIKID